MGIREKAKSLGKILGILEKRYGQGACLGNDPEILDQFVYYLLFYHNPITNARKAFRQFKDDGQFVDWNEVRVATLREVEDVLTGCRAERHTAGTLKSLLTRTFEDFQCVSLENFREEVKVDQIKRFSNSIKGNLPWAQTFLLAASGRDSQVPFDPHTERVATRLRFINVHDTLLKKKKVLKALTQNLEPLRLHGLFVEHGKKLCFETDPRCEKCPLTKDCDFFAKAKRSASKSMAKKKTAAKARTTIKKKTTAKAKKKTKTRAKKKTAAKTTTTSRKKTAAKPKKKTAAKARRKTGRQGKP